MTSATRPRQVRRALHGVLLLDKPLGLSSNDALQKAKWLLRAEKAGHTGTLDPLATGLLPLCFGAATKFSQVSLDADKRYLATLRLGLRTSTGDREGEVIAQRPVHVDRAAVNAACAQFVGPISQVPPMHSAIKKDGRALYEYARAGIEVERAPRAIRIHAITVVAWHDDEVVIDVTCSKGTYIRTLAEDIGQALGCGAHLSALQRTGSGSLQLADATTLDALADMTEAQREARLMPPDGARSARGWRRRVGRSRRRGWGSAGTTMISSLWPCPTAQSRWPRFWQAGRFLTGLRRRVSHPDAAAVRVYGQQPHALLGTAHICAGELIADRLLSPIEVQALRPTAMLAT